MAHAQHPQTRTLVLSRAQQARGKAKPKTDPPGLAARRGALALVTDVLDRGRMLDEVSLDLADPAQRAEARGLADLTLRRLGEIDARLATHVARSPEGPGLAILRLMAAELIFAGTAPHAAVDTGVRLAKSTRGAERLAGLVNAVGRKLVPEGNATEEARAEAPNMAGWLKDRLIRDWGAETMRAIARSHEALAPHDLTLRDPGDAAVLAEELAARRLPTGSLRLATRPQISALPGFAAGAWWAQDAAAALPARLLGDVTGQRVLDLCAAPGGKTLQLAAAGARVTALDISKNRVKRLAENLTRTGLRAEIVIADALKWAPEAAFDAILLDAPCSATGTIRRHPDLPLRKGAGDLTKLTALQARLLTRAYGWLKPGGRMVFATCSLVRAEGEDQIAAFLAAQPEARLDPLEPGRDGLPAAFIDAQGCLRTRPDMWGDLGGLDGFFTARIHRPG